MKKNNRKEKTTFTAREVAVLIEELRGQFRIFGENLSAVKSKVEAIFEEQGRQKEEIFIIKTDINVIKTEIKEIKARLDRVEEDIRLIKNDISSIKENLKTFDKRISHIEAVK